MSHYHQHYSGGIIKSAVGVLWSWSEVPLHHGGVSQIIEQSCGFPQRTCTPSCNWSIRVAASYCSLGTSQRTPEHSCTCLQDFL